MRATHEILVVDKPHLPADDQRYFQSIDALLSAPSEQLTTDRFSGVSRLALERRYYLKRYHGRSNWWRFLLRLDRYSTEVANLRLFTRIGLATPRLVAHGYSASFGVLRRAVMVTEEVPRSLDLQAFLQAGLLYRDGVDGARTVLGQVADAIRLQHQHGFYAADLKPRNVLVGESDGCVQLYFFDCPRGHYSPAWRFRRQRVKDLAHLYRDLQPAVRSVDLMWMFQRYLGKRSLSVEDKRLADRSMQYYVNRRMTKARHRRQHRALGRLHASGIAGLIDPDHEVR